MLDSSLFVKLFFFGIWLSVNMMTTIKIKTTKALRRKKSQHYQYFDEKNHEKINNIENTNNKDVDDINYLLSKSEMIAHNLHAHKL